MKNKTSTKPLSLVSETLKSNGEEMVKIEKMKRELKFHMKAIEIIAKFKRASFDAYMKEGFTAEQALELCKGV